MLFASHNLTAVQKLCERSMLLSRGRKVTEGPTADVIQDYILAVRSDAATLVAERADGEGTGRFRFESPAGRYTVNIFGTAAEIQPTGCKAQPS